MEEGLGQRVPRSREHETGSGGTGEAGLKGAVMGQRGPCATGSVGVLGRK